MVRVEKDDNLLVEDIAASEWRRGNMIASEFIECEEALPWHVAVCSGGGKEPDVLLEHRVPTNG